MRIFRIYICFFFPFFFSSFFCNEFSLKNSFCFQEAKVHIEKIKKKFGQFQNDILEISSELSGPDDKTPEQEESTVQTGIKRQRHHENGEKNGAPAKKIRFNQYVDTLSNNGERAQENLVKTKSFSKKEYAKLHRLMTQFAKIAGEIDEIMQQIRTLRRQCAEIHPICAQCEIPLKGMFFCSDECQHNFDGSEDIGASTTMSRICLNHCI